MIKSSSDKMELFEKKKNTEVNPMHGGVQRFWFEKLIFSVYSVVDFLFIGRRVK